MAAGDGPGNWGEGRMAQQAPADIEHVYAGNNMIHMQIYKDAKHTKYCYHSDHRLCDCCA